MDNQVNFQKRLGTLKRQHQALANGYTTQLRDDGLIVVKPKRVRRSFPLRTLVLVVFGFFAFKGFMLASLGEITYNERVAKLGNGTVAEQAGAWVMQSDPFTTFLAGFIDPLT
ncbi:MAG: hypothetical protein AAFO86_02455 [Pseudomonadota bacterium]